MFPELLGEWQVCSRGGEGQRARQVFQVMRERGILPDVVTLNALLSVCKTNPTQWQWALDIFHQLTSAPSTQLTSGNQLTDICSYDRDIMSY
jgi:pentatricopeptide repeat protein